MLSPASPLFREARYLLADELELHDTGLYHSVLAAIADGNNSRGSIAGYLGRKSGDLAHALTVLEDVGMVMRQADVFRDRRTVFRIAEPLITFYHAIMRPVWSDLEHARDATPLWQRSQRRFVSNVLGPHFEQLCRTWTRHFSPPGLIGDYPNRVGRGTVNDPAAKTTHEVDVVATGLNEDNEPVVLALGEAKWNTTMGLGHVKRLEHVRSLLRGQGVHNVSSAKLACYSAAGFTAELRTATAERDDIVLVDLETIYQKP